MASPQTEDGHVEIANDLWEALMGVGLSRNEYRTILCILRYSYGVKQHYAKLKKREIATLTRIPLGKVNETLSSLEKKNIIRIAQKNGYIYFHKDYDKWKVNETLTLDEKWRAQVNETLSKNLTKREVLGSRNVKLEIPNSTNRANSKASKKRFKESNKERTTILRQIENLLAHFPDDIKALIKEFIELVKEENKTKRITDLKRHRLLNELYNIYRQTAPKEFKIALRITVDNAAPHPNYIKKVLKSRYRQQKTRRKKNERDPHN